MTVTKDVGPQIGSFYFPKALKALSDLESTRAKHEKALAEVRELEVRVGELEEREKIWQAERRILLIRTGKNNEE